MEQIRERWILAIEFVPPPFNFGERPAMNFESILFSRDNKSLTIPTWNDSVGPRTTSLLCGGHFGSLEVAEHAEMVGRDPQEIFVDFGLAFLEFGLALFCGFAHEKMHSNENARFAADFGDWIEQVPVKMQ